jgi:hypothetical protein
MARAAPTGVGRPFALETDEVVRAALYPRQFDPRARREPPEDRARLTTQEEVPSVELFAHLMLADHVAVAGGKFYISGGGWTVRPAQPIQWALALEMRVPWHDNNRRFRFALDLVDADGQPVSNDTPAGSEPVRGEGEFTATAGPGLKPGSELIGLVPMNLPPLPLPPGQQFEWKLTIDGQTREEWRVGFMTYAQPAALAA